jgi:heat shock protein HslJ
MRRRGIVIALGLVGVLALGVILAVMVIATGSRPPAALTQPTWTLTRLVVDGQQQELSPTHPATLHFGAGDGQISGFGGCNSIGGSYSVHGDQLQIGALYSTLIGCLDTVVTSQEASFYAALPRVQTYQIAGTVLTLTDVGGQVQLTFRAS